MLGKSMADFSVEAFDYWAWTCILYQMVVGTPPFRGSNEYQTFKKIMALDYSLPKTLSDSCRSSIKEAFALINSNNNGEFSKSFKRLPFISFAPFETFQTVESLMYEVRCYFKRFLIMRSSLLQISNNGMIKLIRKGRPLFTSVIAANNMKMDEKTLSLKIEGLELLKLYFFNRDDFLSTKKFLHQFIYFS